MFLCSLIDELELKKKAIKQVDPLIVLTSVFKENKKGKCNINTSTLTF